MMRKLSYILLTGLLIVSCRKHEPDSAASAGRIDFSVSEVAQVKAGLINDKTQLVSGDRELGYSVFAARYMPSDPDGTHDLFMSDVKVTSIDDGKTWGYDADPDAEGIQYFYWAPGAVHKFFAVYPYYDTASDTYDRGLTSRVNEEVHALEMYGANDKIYAGTTLDDTGTYSNICPDILYGVAYYPIPFSVKESRDSVVFTLNHALAAVSLRIRNASEYTIDVVEGTKLTGFKNSASNVILSENGAKWNSLDVADGRAFDIPQITDELAPGAYYEPGGSRFWYTALMIPQDFGTYDASPSVSVTVNFSGVESRTYDIRFWDYPVNTVAQYQYAYLPGYHYIYNLNITAAKITCDVEIVPWIEDEPIELN